MTSRHRVGNAVLSADSDSGDMTLDASLGLNNLRVTYKGKLSFMGINIYPHLTGVVRGVNAQAVVQANLLKNTKSLKGFRITKIDRPSVKVSNLGPLGWVTTFVANLVIKPVMGKIRGVLENEVRKLLAKEIAKAPLPKLGY